MEASPKDHDPKKPLQNDPQPARRKRSRWDSVDDDSSTRTGTVNTQSLMEAASDHASTIPVLAGLEAGNDFSRNWQENFSASRHATEVRPAEPKSSKFSRWEPVDVMSVEMKDLQGRLDAITRIINSNQIPVDDLCRSPSPEPMYDSKGKRINTRLDRAADKLEKQRHELCDRLKEIDPHSFRPPPGMRPLRVSKKMYLKNEQHPDLNFIGLILGPRGNTHKRLEKDFNVRVAIRGKGSVRDGRGRNPQPDDNDDLHVVISGEGSDAAERIENCVKRIQVLITPMDDDVNEHKQRQLRELAELNGTLKRPEYGIEGMGFRRPGMERNFHSSGAVVTRDIDTCIHCGDRNHVAKECPLEGNLNQEYSSFMKEVASGGDGSHDTRSKPMLDPNAAQGDGGRFQGRKSELSHQSPSITFGLNRGLVPRDLQDLLTADVPTPPWKHVQLPWLPQMLPPAEPFYNGISIGINGVGLPPCLQEEIHAPPPPPPPLPPPPPPAAEGWRA